MTCLGSSKKFWGFLAWHHLSYETWLARLRNVLNAHPLGIKHHTRLLVCSEKKEITSTWVRTGRSSSKSLVLADFEMHEAQTHLCYPEGVSTFYILILFSHLSKKNSLNRFSVPRTASWKGGRGSLLGGGCGLLWPKTQSGSPFGATTMSVHVVLKSGVLSTMLKMRPVRCSDSLGPEDGQANVRRISLYVEDTRETQPCSGGI